MTSNEGTLARLAILGRIIGTPAKLCRDEEATWIGVEFEGELLASVPWTTPDASFIALAEALRW